MSAYGKAALIAVRQCRTSRTNDPVAAWKAAVREVFPASTSQQKKGCPQGAFLGLCGEGLITGILAGSYTRSKLNRKYAVEAVELLRSNCKLSEDRGGLWKRVIGDSAKAHNNQMDVVLALWGAGFISH